MLADTPRPSVCTGVSVENATSTPFIPCFLSSLLIILAKGQTSVCEMSAIFKRDGSSLFAAPIALIKGTPLLYKEIYNTIDLFCQTKGLETPPYKRELIGQIAVEYPLTQQDLKKTNDIEFIKRHSVKYQLAQRLPNLNEPINSLNYFVKVLTNKDYIIPPKKEPQKFII